jgi:lycopene cyclase domain-containing protein
VKKHLYSLIALAVIAGPLALSFDDKVHFFSHAPAAALALVVTGVLYLFWDSLVVLRGDWTFNPEFTGEFRIFRLPVGEILFFVAVPYSCLFLFEVVKAYFPGTDLVTVNPSFLFAGALVFVVAAWLFRTRGYTLLALASVALFLSTLALTHPSLVGRTEFWIWFGICFVAFAAVNGLYTALPTIFYNPKAIWGIKVGTIPLEDFFYNLSYLGLTLCFYLVFDGWFAGTITP